MTTWKQAWRELPNALIEGAKNWALDRKQTDDAALYGKTVHEMWDMAVTAAVVGYTPTTLEQSMRPLRYVLGQDIVPLQDWQNTVARQVLTVPSSATAASVTAASECDALTAELNAVAKGLPYPAVELLKMALGQIRIGVRLRNMQRDYALSAMRYVVVQPINGGTDWYNLAAFTGKYAATEWAKANTPENLHGDYPLEVRELGTEYTS